MYHASMSTIVALLNGVFIASAIIGVAAVDSETPSWDDLVSSLSGDATFQESSVDSWFDQCVLPFADLNSPQMGVCLEDESIDCPVSNYQLFMQPSGLCMGAAKCAYEKCAGGPDTPFNRFTFNSTTLPEELWKDADNFDLPTAVVHPAHVGDVSAAIKFAAEHKIGVSVKTSGHSYTGSSTKKGTILMNLSKLQKYAPSGSIVECQVDPNIKEGAFQDACNYAIGRNKPAVVRVGGGEIWDEVLRAVSVDWNEDEKNTKKYHIVSGAAGTVSAAGGWLASGGLSGNNGMRLYGLGVDQVLHVEMVLPSGMHVRFGPTDWRKKANKMYAVTTHVKGYCNQGDLSDEDLWDWQECSQDIDFYGLWFAVRGGGGGSYGVITSIYYQLHDYTPLDLVSVLSFPGVDVGSLQVEKLLEILKKSAEFILRFLFLPESIGVTEFASNSCSSPDSGGIAGGSFMCFNGAGSIMKGAWERFYPNDLLGLSVNTVPSWGHVMVGEGTKNSNVPEGRAADDPRPLIYPSFRTFFNPSIQEVETFEYMVFPVDAITNKLDKVCDMLVQCILEGKCTGTMYIFGGKILSADDGMSPLPPHRRYGAFNMMVTSPAWRTKFKQLFYGAEDGKPFVGDSFPGELCHNHASATFPTALKDDWTKGCDPRWPEEERKERCLSHQEAAWGTDILIKLQGIHAAVDPDNLFNCWDCVGNAPDLKKEKKKDKKKDKETKKKMKKYPDCNPDDWTEVGDGYCDSVYNVAECGFDGGDCM